MGGSGGGRRGGESGRRGGGGGGGEAEEGGGGGREDEAAVRVDQGEREVPRAEEDEGRAARGGEQAGDPRLHREGEGRGRVRRDWMRQE